MHMMCFCHCVDNIYVLLQLLVVHHKFNISLAAAPSIHHNLISKYIICIPIVSLVFVFHGAAAITRRCWVIAILWRSM